MLDIKYIRQHPEEVEKAIQVKNIDLNLDELLDLDKKTLQTHQQIQEWQRKKKENAENFKTLSNKEEKQTSILLGRKISSQIANLQSQIKKTQEQLNQLLLKVPNIPSPETPIGNSSENNEVIKTVGEKTNLIKSHVDFLVEKDWADFYKIAQTAGSRSYLLKNKAVLLEQALIQWGIQFLIKKNFQILSLPNFGDRHSFVASGHFPEGADQVYFIEKDNSYLTGTAEVILNSLYKKEILPAGKLPLLLGGLSPCFRREAGSAGKNVKGLLRVHQFVKLEQYIICEKSYKESNHWHNFLLNNVEEILQTLELPYQVVSISTGDMGAGKYKMHDVECWLPSLGKYVETHSCSSLLDWQARRTPLRYRDKENKVHYCYTLNNTALALPRLLAVFIENHQKQDGSVYIPPVLGPFLQGAEVLK